MMLFYLYISVLFVVAYASWDSDEGDFSGPGKTFIRNAVFTDQAPKPVGPYSQAMQYGRTYYLSGLLGIDKDTMKLVPGGAEPEVQKLLENMRAILDQANCEFSNVLKTTVYLQNMDDFVAVNEKYKEFFREPFPARTTLEVSRLPLGAKVVIDAVVGFGNATLPAPPVFVDPDDESGDSYSVAPGLEVQQKRKNKTLSINV